MIETTGNDMALARVSVVNVQGRTVLDVFVLPCEPTYIVDCRTAITGLDKHDLVEKGVTVREAQRRFAGLCCPETVLMGHALDHDLLALGFRHDLVIDTSFLFPVLDAALAGPTPFVSNGNAKTVGDAKTITYSKHERKGVFKQTCLPSSLVLVILVILSRATPFSGISNTGNAISWCHCNCRGYGAAWADPRTPRCVLAGMDDGFCTFNTEPFAEGTWRKLETGGVGAVELLYRSNILALVGGGSCPNWSVNKVMLWDDSKKRCVGELGFQTPVKGVRMRKDIVVVVLEKNVFVYNFLDLRVRYSFDTAPNPRGLCGLSLEQQNRVLAYPGLARGSIQVECLGETSVEASRTIQAHESEIYALAVTRDGGLVASASERGTLIRVFVARTGALLHELRRGTDGASIHSICFDATSSLLACTSDKCTVHIFEVASVPGQHTSSQQVEASQAGAGAEEGHFSASVGAAEADSHVGASLSSSLPQNLANMAGHAQSMLRENLGEYLPKYFTTETRRSCVRFPVQQTTTVCAFGAKPNSLLVAGYDGSFSQFSFDPVSGSHERTYLSSIFPA
ncbi:Autophagy-related protein 18 [Hondaea fermentalgiana]|uniref:Autophagy-related protein 18 n=1 Tax=Hondaea fermentalgiana TaxID=2315210 RepID=A0A2R5G3Q7_9STRA|nr:Autophagy-related protein 18 [Hondaea fermentalgiana]|eukprot:GBG24388.1 Autophagy-related protein 18 [Hondaea fermentalgiana]